MAFMYISTIFLRFSLEVIFQKTFVDIFHYISLRSHFKTVLWTLDVYSNVIFFPSCNCRLLSGSFSRAFAALMICLFMLVIFSFVRDLLACFHIKDFYFSSSSKVATLTNSLARNQSKKKGFAPKPN